jgi:uncharacterized repeat protein (TIGR04138 family)
VEQEDLLCKLEDIVSSDPRYRLEAYVFVIQALEYTMTKLGRRGHVRGKELLEGVRGLASDQFGPTAKMVLENWGVRKTEDIGEIVFIMVDAGVLGKTEDDSKEDFKDVYDFAEVFEKQYDWRIDGAI